MEETRTQPEVNIFTRQALETFPDIEDGEVHVWQARTNAPDSCADELKALLSEDERVRADQYHFRKDREHYVTRRAMLRLILGRYMSVNPERLKFSYGRHGKPLLLDENGREVIHFNLSHSERTTLLAVSLSGAVGVDVEYLRDDFPEEQVARHFCSAAELACLGKLSDRQRREAFYRSWTRKEAYVKALGAGMFFNLKDIKVSLEDAYRPVLLDVKNGPREFYGWSAWPLKPAINCIAALVIKCEKPRVKCFSAS